MALKEGQFKEVVDAAIASGRALALEQGKVQEAIANLLVTEKETRLANDSIETSRIAIAILEICFEVKQWKDLIENIFILSKRRGQLKMVLTKLVQKACEYVDKVGEADKLELIDCLCAVSEGKIHVENERANLIRIKAKMKEKDGKISEACELMQEVQVETYGTMEKKEKTDFLLEQVRLCLDCKDYVRAMIIIRKINTKVFADESMQELKTRYYRLLIDYHTHHSNYIEIARCHLHIFETPSVEADSTKAIYALKRAVVFITLSPYSHEQSDFLNRTYLKKKLEDLPKFKELLKKFITYELIAWKKFQPEFQNALKEELTSENDLFKFFKESNTKHWNDLHRRVIEHNIRVISTYYARITSKRLNELLELSAKETEEHLCELVVSKTIYARIDRPAGIITFQKPKEASQLLDDWASNVAELLQSLEKTCHVIHKENMLYKI